MSEYWSEDLSNFESQDNTTPLEYIECQFVFNLEPASYDTEDLPIIDPKCELCPVQKIMRAHAANLLKDRDGQTKFLLALMGKQGKEFEEHLAEMMGPEDVATKKALIIANKEEVLTELDNELDEIKQEMSALSWDCLGTRSGEDSSIGRPVIHYIFCDSELVNDAEGDKPSPVPAYIWIEPDKF